jgi:hypothetical protein
MPRPNWSRRLPLASNLGRRALVFDEDDVVRLLRASVEREGGQTAFAKRHGGNRSYVSIVLSGKRRMGDSIVRALGLRKAYVAE